MNPGQTTYVPGGPDYDNFNYQQGVPGFFPNSGWGSPSSPGYAAAAPRHDFMSRGQQYAGNQAFGPPAGINMGSMATNMAAMMVMPMIFGPEKAQSMMQNFRPMVRPDIPDVDYLRAKMRSSESFGMREQLYGMDAKFRDRTMGKFGSTEVAKTLWDQVNPAGSNVGAFETVYGRMGPAFGKDLSSQASKSMQAIKDMNESFTLKTGSNAGGWDWNASHGYGKEEMLGQHDSFSRYGVGQFSKESFASADKEGRGKILRDSSRLASAASNVFGKDKTSDELAQLMTKTIEGVQGMDPNKATELLNKIQAASRAVDISTQAFASYKTMIDDLGRSMGVRSGASVQDVSNLAINAKSLTQDGQARRDVNLSDQSKNMEALAWHAADFAGSKTGKKAQTIAAMLTEMTPSQRAAVKMADGSTGQDFLNGGMKSLMEGGDIGAIEKMIGHVESGKSGMNVDAFQRRAAFAGEDTARKAQGVFNVGAAGVAIHNKQARRRVFDEMSKVLSTRERDAITERGGLAAVMEGMTSTDLTDQGKYIEGLNRIGITGASAASIAKRLSEEAGAIREMAKNSPQGQGVFGKGFDQIFAPPNKTRMAGLTQEARRGELLQRMLQDATGGSLRGMGVKDLLATGLETFKDINEGKIKMEGGETLKWTDITDGGKLNLDKLIKVAPKAAAGILKNFAERAAGSGGMKALIDATDPKVQDEVLAKGEAAYQKAKKDGANEEDAESQREAVIDAFSKSLSRKTNGEDALVPPAGDLQAVKDPMSTDGKDHGSGKVVGAIEDLFNWLKTKYDGEVAPEAPARGGWYR